jgi:hypothetical protein
MIRVIASYKNLLFFFCLLNFFNFAPAAKITFEFKARGKIISTNCSLCVKLFIILLFDFEVRFISLENQRNNSSTHFKYIEHKIVYKDFLKTFLSLLPIVGLISSHSWFSLQLIVGSHLMPIIGLVFNPFVILF